jgi:hypothetical protein
MIRPMTPSTMAIMMGVAIAYPDFRFVDGLMRPVDSSNTPSPEVETTKNPIHKKTESPVFTGLSSI